MTAVVGLPPPETAPTVRAVQYVVAESPGGGRSAAVCTACVGLDWLDRELDLA